MFNHVEIDYPSLDGRRLMVLDIMILPNGKKLVSITSVISHYNRERSSLSGENVLVWKKQTRLLTNKQSSKY